MHLKSNTSIELLPENIIDQIKAGEVIEGPANILKELLENSIDANSKSIDVHIENNGLDLIAVCDDGIGITKEDLPLAFHRHATSKLSNFEDLFKLYSYGFRGEALASIASISKISCETIHIKGQHSLFTIEGGRVMAHVCLSQHSQQKAGTKIFVKDLFFNTPVRVKFLRSQQALRNSLKRIMDAFLLAAPEIKFTCRWDNKDKQMFFAETGEDSLFNRVGQLFKIDKRKLKDSLLVSEQSYDDYHLKIYIDKKFTKGFANKKQYILVNNRSIEDKKLHNILLQYLQPLWPQGHSGNYVIKIDLPPDHLDVNVHPQKSCIRFYKSSDVHALLIATVKQLTKNIASNEQSSTTFNPRVDLNTDVSNFKQRYLEDSFAPQSSPSSLLSFDWDYNFLLPFNSSVYGVSLHQWIKLWLNKKFDRIPLAENQIVPLLICSPFNVVIKTIERHFSDLNNLGLDFDPLDENTLVLRTLPEFMDDLPWQKLIDEFLQKLSQEKILAATIDKFFIESIGCSSYLKLSEINNSFLISIINEFDFNLLIKHKIIKQINENNISKFLKTHEN